MDPYQAWRRGLISYETYLIKKVSNNIDVAASEQTPEDPGDYGTTCASPWTITGEISLNTNDLGLLVAHTGSLTVADGGSLIIT